MSDALAALPAPVREWVARTVAPDAPLVHRVELDTHGGIRLGRWCRYTAHQVLAAPDGLEWQGTARLAGIPVTVFDTYHAGAAETRTTIAGRVALGRRRDRDVVRSAAGRLAAEALLLPTNALAPWVRWEATGDSHAVAEIEVGGAVYAVEVVLDHGRLRSVALPRWCPTRAGGRSRVFGVTFHGERREHGITMPASWTAGWDWTGDGWQAGPFFTAQLDAVRFQPASRRVRPPTSEVAEPVGGPAKVVAMIGVGDGDEGVGAFADRAAP